MRKLCRNKRGLSTVISTILMIMVVMIGMSLLFAYVVFYAQNYKEGIGGSVLESLTIEDVWKVDSQHLQVSLYNTGTKANLGTDVNLNVAAIYVDGAALFNYQGDAATNHNFGTINFNENAVNAGQHVQFIGQFQTLASGTHEIAIATIRGSNFKAAFNVP